MDKLHIPKTEKQAVLQQCSAAVKQIRETPRPSLETIDRKLDVIIDVLMELAKDTATQRR